jgi:4-amino-4-deoxy-L-arabinose transferase-like glycosyltransferase
MSLVINYKDFQEDEKQLKTIKHFWWVVLLIIIFSAIIKLPTLNLPHKEGDEIAFWYLAKNWIETGKYTLKGSALEKSALYYGRATREMPVHPPMFPLLLRPFVKNNAPNYAVIASWIGHFLAILAVALIGSFLFLKYELGLSAFSPLFWIPLLGIATDPIMTYVSGIIWIDNLHAGWAALAVAFAMMANTSIRPKLMYVISGILLGCALLSKVTSAIIVPVIIYIIIINETNNKNRLQELLFGAIPALILSLPWYVPLYYTMGDFLFIFGDPTPEYQELTNNMSPEELAKYKEASRCRFCEAGGASPWYYLLAKLPLIAPLVALSIIFYIIFYFVYIKTLDKIKQLNFFTPFIWFTLVLTFAVSLQIYIHRRLTVLVAGIYIMFYMLIVFSEKYETLKKYQNVLLLLGSLCIIYGALTGSYYTFNGNHAEIFSIPEKIGLVKLWGG